MSIDNLLISLFNSTLSGGISALEPSSQIPHDSSGKTAFLEQLAEQMAKIGDPVAAQSIVDNLNSELIAAASGLPGGNLLPHPGNLDPRTSLSGDGLNSIDPNEPGSESALALTRLGTPIQPRAEPRPQVPQGAATGQDSLQSTRTPSGGDQAGFRPLDESGVETEISLHRDSGNISVEDIRTGKDEWLSVHASVRGQSDPAGTTVLRVDRPIDHPEWKQDLGDRIVWMAQNSKSSAELKINPPQMGPVEIRINLNNDQMNVMFASSNAAVRDAIEAAVPRLREMMGAQQLNLINVELSDSFADQGRHSADGEAGGRQHGEHLLPPNPVIEESGSHTSDALNIRINQGLLNYYV
jgi:Flagellar hook-length control protein FliK